MGEMGVGVGVCTTYLLTNSNTFLVKMSMQPHNITGSFEIEINKKTLTP